MSVYVNLPVGDIEQSRGFFSKLGFSFDERFSDATALADPDGHSRSDP